MLYWHVHRIIGVTPQSFRATLGLSKLLKKPGSPRFGSVRFGSVSVNSGSARFRFGPVPVQLGSGSFFLIPKSIFLLKKQNRNQDLPELERTGTGPNRSRPNRNRTEPNRSLPVFIPPPYPPLPPKKRNWTCKTGTVVTRGNRLEPNRTD